VAGSGASYTVTVSGIDGNGTLGLDIAGGHNIADLAANALDTTPTTDQVYTIPNVAPTLTATGVNPTFTEGGANADLFSSVTIDTVESGQTVAELKFTVTNVSDDTDEIVVIDGDEITLTDGNSSTTGANGFGYSISLGGSTATVTLTTTGASEAAAQTLVDGLAYRNSSDDPTTAVRVATLTSIKDSGATVYGGDDTTALSIASTVTVITVNDAPTLSATGLDPTFRKAAPGSTCSAASRSARLKRTRPSKN
jgi:hypothetical protein